ncbi:MAG: hypothetical protein AAGG48_07065 [Planctomycetota bacterium]
MSGLLIANRLCRRQVLCSVMTAAASLACRSSIANTLRRPHNTSIAFSADGKFVVVGSQAGVEVRQSESLTVLRTIELEMDSIHDVCFSPDGRWLAVAGGFPGETGEVAWISWPSGEVDHNVNVHDDVVHQVVFVPDGSHWITASADEVCSVFPWEGKKPITRYTQHSRGVLGVTVLPDGETVVSGSRDETLRVWNLRSGESIRTLHNHSRDVTAVACQAKDGGLPVVASASDDLTVRFWQPTIGRMVRFARVPSRPLGMAWTTDGRLAVPCSDGVLRWIDPQTVAIVDAQQATDDWLYCVATDHRQDGRVVVGGAYGMVGELRPKVRS